MELEKKVKLLQLMYVGALADSLRWYTKEGILDKVTEAKKQEQFHTGKQSILQFGMKKPVDVFNNLSELFNCAVWEISEEGSSLKAETKGCLLCGYAKKLNTGSPCEMYCLHPMEGMVKGLDAGYEFRVESTLWNGERCRIVVSKGE